MQLDLAEPELEQRKIAFKNELQETSFEHGSLASLPKESLQEEQLVAAYFTDSFQTQSLQAKEFEAALGSLNQLDLEHSVGFTEFASPKLSHQQQTESFHRISFELRALHCAAFA